jgi:hypothetical protein
MLEKRILNNLISTDVLQFSELLNEYTELQKDSSNPIYFYEDMQSYATWLKHQFENRNVKDFVVAGIFDDEQLIQIMVGYKIEVAWHKPVVEDTMPYYAIGLTYFKQRCWRVPEKDISNLDKIISKHFEDQGFTTGFITIKAPAYIIKTSNPVDINRYIDSVFIKTFGNNTHNFFVERVFRTNDELQAYKFRAFKALLPRRIKRPIVLLSFELSPEYKII